MTAPTLPPGIERFAARTPTLPPATHTNSYALGARDVLLVEPSPSDAGEIRAWIEWARGLETKGRNLTAIVLTHHHIDHAGGAETISRELGLPLWMHPLTAKRLGFAADQPLNDDDVLKLGGRSPQAWTVLHTPGHAPGHVCLYEASLKTLIVGDMVASLGTILIEPTDGDMAVYLRQLQRLSDLGATLALPAHGDPIASPSGLFQRYIGHRLMRETRVAASLQASPQTLDELVQVAYADTDESLWPIAKMSLEAHLIKLEGESAAKRKNGGWMRA